MFRWVYVIVVGIGKVVALVVTFASLICIAEVLRTTGPFYDFIVSG